MKTYLSNILLLSLCCSLTSKAQDAKPNVPGSSNKKEILPAKLSIIAIGPKPPRRFGSADEDKPNSAAVLLPPLPGEIPPRRLYFTVGEKDNKITDSKREKNNPQPKQELKSINVTFNNPSHFIDVPSNKTLKLQRRNSISGNELSDYISIEPLKPGSLTVVLLRPSGLGNKRWVSEPTQYKINLLDEELSNKRLSILNLSRRPIKSIFHQDKKLIEPGDFQSYESIEGLGLHRIAAAYGQEDRVIYNTALRLNRSNRLLFYVLYDSNPNTNDGRTVGLFRTNMDSEEIKKEEKDRPKDKAPENEPE